jgi:hypothetical protein
MARKGGNRRKNRQGDKMHSIFRNVKKGYKKR